MGRRPCIDEPNQRHKPTPNTPHTEHTIRHKCIQNHSIRTYKNRRPPTNQQPPFEIFTNYIHTHITTEQNINDVYNGSQCIERHTYTHTHDTKTLNGISRITCCIITIFERYFFYISAERILIYKRNTSIINSLSFVCIKFWVFQCV